MNPHCPKEKLEDYVDELLTTLESEQVRLHLEHCETCRVEVEALLNVDRQVAMAWNCVDVSNTHLSTSTKHSKTNLHSKTDSRPETSRPRLAFAGLAASILLSLGMVFVLLSIQPQPRAVTDPFPDSKSGVTDSTPSGPEAPTEKPVAKASFHGNSMGKALNVDSDFTVFQVLPTPIEQDSIN